MTPGQDKPREKDLSDIVGIWPSAVWILTGVHFYMSQPDLFVGWKGGLYFVLGTILVALIMGLAGRNLRRGVLTMLAESFRDEARVSAIIGTLMRVMITVGEAVLVSLLARSLLEALG